VRGAVRAARALSALSRRVGAGEGGVVGGRVALALAPGTLRCLAAGRRVVLVTGTNGKTTTAHLLAAALRTAGPVAHNATGANMADGVTAALIAAPDARDAVLEVDELHLPRVLGQVDPAVVVLLNLTRDQLDRGTEVAGVARVVRSALATGPAVVVANRDDPVVAGLARGLPRVVWVSPGRGWAQDGAPCPVCGDHPAGAGGCPPALPPAAWTLRGNAVDGPTGRTDLALRLPGRFNEGNAAMALAAAAALGVAPAVAAAAMVGVRTVAGRYDVVEREGRRLRLLLAKNPAGWQETLPLLGADAPVVLAVNAHEADGRDTSWLWDVPFERLPPAPVVAAGEMAADVGLRLSYAGVPHRTVADPLAALRTLPPGPVTVVANYTAFLALRRRLGVAA
jgi:UDP-N-acetylmuramyl tripeptide synthase